MPPLPDDLPVRRRAGVQPGRRGTTEIDDAFSVTRVPDGGLRIGIHIAAPALGFAPGSPIDAIARERLSTVYMPGDKITMLPTDVVQRYTLAEGGVRPAVSLYLDVEPETLVIDRRGDAASNACRSPPTCATRSIDPLNDTPRRRPRRSGACRSPRTSNCSIASPARCEAARGKSRRRCSSARSISFDVENDRVRIVERKRGAPLDKLVAELMILRQRHLGPAARRARRRRRSTARSPGGKVRMTTVAAAHEGLGVSHYAWSSSPLRRYVDLVNQWQLVASLRGDAPPYPPKSADLLAALRDFESTYAALR